VAAGGWAGLTERRERMEAAAATSPPPFVVSPVALTLRTQTRRDTLRHVFDVT